MLENLKKCVCDYLKKESEVQASTKRSLTIRIAELEHKSDRLFNAYIDGKCDEATYNKMKAQIEADKAELQDTSKKYGEIDSEMYEIVDNVALIAKNARKMLNSPIISSRRAILGLLLSDSVINEKNLSFRVLSPFDKLLKTTDCNAWCPQQESDLRLVLTKDLFYHYTMRALARIIHNRIQIAILKIHMFFIGSKGGNSSSAAPRLPLEIRRCRPAYFRPPISHG